MSTFVNILIFLVLYQSLLVATAKYNCDTKETVYLKTGYLAFFETNNYPAPLNEEEFAASLLITSTTTKLYDAFSAEISHYKTFNFFQSTSFSLKNHHHTKQFFSSMPIAQEGFVVFADSNKTWGCPLENDRDPIKILSELEIIYIFDNGFFNLSSTYCIWRFSGPQKYGFKVVIADLDDAKETEFYIRNSTEIFVNKRSAKVLYPYYNEDNYIEIQLSNNQATSFLAFISIVKKTVGTDECYTTKNETTTTWHLDTWKRGHIFNVKCHFEIIIPESIEYIIRIFYFVIEKNVDYIRYYSDRDNNSISVELSPLYVQADTVFKLFNYNNGSNQRYIFEYLNDGSLPSLGTSISFTKIKCQCVGPIIPCSKTQGFGGTGIMEREEGYYCGYLRCVFVLEPCLNGEMTSLRLWFYGQLYYDVFQDVDDIFKVYSNGYLVMELRLKHFIQGTGIEYLAYLNSSNLNTLEVITNPSNAAKRLIVSTWPASAPNITNQVEISEDTPFTIIDVGAFYHWGTSVDTIYKINEIKNPTLIIYSNIENGIQLFNNESLSVNYNNRICFGEDNPYSCKVNNNMLAILRSRSLQFMLGYPFLTIQLQSYHQKGCIFQKYIFSAHGQYNFSVVAIATDEDYCISTILLKIELTYHYFISKLWTTSVKENVKVYAGTENLFFEFNSHTAKTWTSIELYSSVYTIRVPKGTSMYLQIQRLDDPAMNLGVIVLGNFRSLFSTFHYGTSKGNVYVAHPVKYCVYGRKLKFTVIYYKTRDFSYYFQLGQNLQVKTGDVILVEENTCVFLVYDIEALQEIDDGVIFLIESITDNEILI